MIGIVDYGLGNLGSIQNMLRNLGLPCLLSSDADELNACERYILPGVGAFDQGMTNLVQSGLDKLLQRRVKGEGAPCLGICLGMQLMTEGSEEGQLPGLGWFPARTVAFNRLPHLRYPHMGWNEVQITSKHAPWSQLPAESRFYFVHSYRVESRDPRLVALTASHGETFCAAIADGTTMGVQFHPEKSHSYGKALLEVFGTLK